MYNLVYAQETLELHNNSTFKLGRAPSNDVVCPDSKASRFHGEFKVEQGQLSYRDLESTNGSSVSGKKLAPYKWEILADGATIEIGSWQARVSKNPSKIQDAPPVANPIPTPTVDPSGADQSAYELTSKRQIPPGLQQDGSAG